jgi:hypothetical protein
MQSKAILNAYIAEIPIICSNASYECSDLHNVLKNKFIENNNYSQFTFSFTQLQNQLQKNDVFFIKVPVYIDSGGDNYHFFVGVVLDNNQIEIVQRWGHTPMYRKVIDKTTLINYFIILELHANNIEIKNQDLLDRLDNYIDLIFGKEHTLKAIVEKEFNKPDELGIYEGITNNNIRNDIRKNILNQYKNSLTDNNFQITIFRPNTIQGGRRLKTLKKRKNKRKNKSLRKK